MKIIEGWSFQNYKKLCKLITPLFQILHVYELFFFLHYLIFITLTLYYTLKITLLCIEFYSHIFYFQCFACTMCSFNYSFTHKLFNYSFISLFNHLFTSLLLFVHFHTFAFIKHWYFFLVYFQIIPQAEYIMFDFSHLS
jgi:hypothetical protein